MSCIRSMKRTASIVALSISLMVPYLSADAARLVYDPWNYRQNILTAVRSLSEINQQIEQLRNEANVLLKMDLDLSKLTETISPELATTLGEIKTLMQDAEAIALKVRDTDQAMRDLFPKELSESLSGDEVLRNAKARWDEALSSYKRSANLQAKISENVDTDSGLLNTLLSRSRGAAGNLQAAQAGNELTGLSVKQSLQLQQLLAIQARADTVDRARQLSSEEEARMQFKNFLGTSSAYSP